MDLLVKILSIKLIKPMVNVLKISITEIILMPSMTAMKYFLLYFKPLEISTFVNILLFLLFLQVYDIRKQCNPQPLCYDLSPITSYLNVLISVFFLIEIAPIYSPKIGCRKCSMGTL